MQASSTSEKFYEWSHWASGLAKRKPKPLNTVAFGSYRIRSYCRLIKSEVFPGHYYHKTASLALSRRGQVVGYSMGELHDLAAYADSDSLIYDLDALSGVALDVARLVQLLGDEFWASRDLLYACSLTEVLPTHRHKGLGAALAVARMTAAPLDHRSVIVALQPFPLELQPQHSPERDEAPFTEEQQSAMHSRLREYWLRVFPWLERAPDIPGSDRHFLIGELPDSMREGEV